MSTDDKSKIDFTQIASLELMEYMAMKVDFPKEAQSAFMEFCSRFDQEIIRKAEIYCSKFNYGPGVALEISQCTFAKVWKYPTFKIEKSTKKNPEKGIIIWMLRILYTQLVKYGKQQFCAEPTEEEDLSLITNIDDLIAVKIPDGDEYSKKKLKSALQVVDAAFAALTPKHKIIYLTYKAYEIPGKYLPRTLTKKLQDTLELTHSTIKVYKKDANDHIKKYLDTINGK